MNYKNLKLLPFFIALPIAILCFTSYLGHKNNEFIYLNRYNFKLKKKKDVTGKFYKYFFDKKHSLTSFEIGDQIMLGDSIYKAKESYIIQVYKKNDNNQYNFYNTYSFEKK